MQEKTRIHSFPVFFCDASVPYQSQSYIQHCYLDEEVLHECSAFHQS